MGSIMGNTSTIYRISNDDCSINYYTVSETASELDKINNSLNKLKKELENEKKEVIFYKNRSSRREWRKSYKRRH